MPRRRPYLQLEPALLRSHPDLLTGLISRNCSGEKATTVSWVFWHLMWPASLFTEGTKHVSLFDSCIQAHQYYMTLLVWYYNGVCSHQLHRLLALLALVCFITKASFVNLEACQALRA
jgi:hypothetical protein